MGSEEGNSVAEIATLLTYLQIYGGADRKIESGFECSWYHERLRYAMP